MPKPEEKIRLAQLQFITYVCTNFEIIAAKLYGKFCATKLLLPGTCVEEMAMFKGINS